MTKNLAMDLAKYGIRVNAICPGWIESPLVDEWFEAQEDPEAAKNYVYTSHPLGRIGTPTDCGRACVFLASDADAGFLTGVEIDVEGAITFGY
jgi:NAD(P)-dependent dehydrogenase (short-subunit alcohol dehydrogenase family)